MKPLRRGRRSSRAGRAVPFACAVMGLCVVAGACTRPSAAPNRASVATRGDADADVRDVEFVERLTAGARSTDRLPLLVVIHGLGDTPENFVHVFEGLAVPARIVAVRGIDPWPVGRAWFGMRAPGDWSSVASGVRRATLALSRALASYRTRWTSCGTPIVSGFSQGGMLSFALGVAAPPVVGAALPIGGLLPRGLWPEARPGGEAQPPIDAYHGTADTRVPLSDARALIERLRAIGFAAVLHEYAEVGHEIPEGMQRDVLRRIEQHVVRMGCAPTAVAASR